MLRNREAGAGRIRSKQRANVSIYSFVLRKSRPSAILSNFQESGWLIQKSLVETILDAPMGELDCDFRRERTPPRAKRLSVAAANAIAI